MDSGVGRARTPGVQAPDQGRHHRRRQPHQARAPGRWRGRRDPQRRQHQGDRHIGQEELPRHPRPRSIRPSRRTRSCRGASRRRRVELHSGQARHSVASPARQLRTRPGTDIRDAGSAASTRWATLLLVREALDRPVPQKDCVRAMPAPHAEDRPRRADPREPRASDDGVHVRPRSRPPNGHKPPSRGAGARPSRKRARLLPTPWGSRRGRPGELGGQAASPKCPHLPHAAAAVAPLRQLRDHRPGSPSSRVGIGGASAQPPGRPTALKPRAVRGPSTCPFTSSAVLPDESTIAQRQHRTRVAAVRAVTRTPDRVVEST